ncbi:hypothetical protein ACO9S2_10700 [Nitrospira sp. NS4]|uniref:hypothetical protein n=1 Tax=Nitrospira sp. NS4 TaxID=3414498 RepID=UPI003C2DFA6A
MRPTTFTPLDLSDYDISPEQGFLPQGPLEDLPDSATLNQLGYELPKQLSARRVGRFIDEQRQLLQSMPEPWGDQDYQAKMRNLKS